MNEAMPRGYGLAFMYVERHEAVIYPIPFNYVAGLAYRLWCRLKVGPTGWQTAYDKGYHQGLNEGKDLGKRIVYNKVLTEEIGGILSRYGQLQVKMLHASNSEIQKALRQFTQDEIERFKMELQDR